MFESRAVGLTNDLHSEMEVKEIDFQREEDPP